jgi:hypothetical protein
MYEERQKVQVKSEGNTSLYSDPRSIFNHPMYTCWWSRCLLMSIGASVLLACEDTSFPNKQ